MKAEIITISSDVLIGQALNINVAFLARELIAMGIPIQQSVMLRNNSEDLKHAVKMAEERSDLIIITGGLGPDEDDISIITISEYLDVPLVLDNKTADRIISYHQNSNLPMPKYNQLQAMTLTDALPLENITGLATGGFHTNEKTTYILLPGLYEELRPMFVENTRPLIIEKLLNDVVIETQIYSLYGLTLADVNQQLGELITYDKNPFVGIYCENDEVEIQITAKADSKKEAKAIMNEVALQVKNRVGEYIFSEKEERLAQVVKRLLKAQDKKITAAESLTGGYFLDIISGEPESSDIFEGGIVTYSANIKKNVLKVTAETLDKYGMVSPQCAIEMAEKSMEMFEADISISLTGVAGPSSLEGEIPGTVWIGLAQAGKETFAKKFHFEYKRQRNRKNSVLSGLNLARLALLGKPIENQVFFNQQ